MNLSQDKNPSENTQKTSGENAKNFRSPADIRLIRLMIYGFLIQSIIVCGLAIAVGVLVFRRPERIVAVTSPDGQRVVELDGRQVDVKEPVVLGKEQLSDADKTELVAQFCKSLYVVNRTTRDVEVPKALRMMVPENAAYYANYLKEKRVLQTENDEQWQAIWTKQDIHVDERDPFTVHVLGKQTITKIINGQAKTEELQHQLDFKLTTNGVRDSDNLRTGFQIVSFDGKVIRPNTAG